MPRASTGTVLAVVLVVATLLPLAVLAGASMKVLGEQAARERALAHENAALADATRVATVLARSDAGPAEALREAGAQPDAYLLAPDGTRTNRHGPLPPDPALADAVGTRVSGTNGEIAWARVADQNLVLVSPTPPSTFLAPESVPLLAGGLALAGLGMAAVGLTFARARITRPLRELATATRRVADGEWDATVPEAGTAETAALAHDFNSMAHQIAAKQAKLSQANARLEALAEARTEQLVEAAEDLHAYQFTLDHELREPLRSVDTLLGLWMQELTEALGNEDQEVLATIRARTQRLQRVIGDLMALDQWAHRPLALADVPLNAALEDAFARIRDHVDRADGVVEREGDLPRVRADPEALAELFARLAENGVTFNDAATPRVRVHVVHEDAHDVAIAVDDNGIGIPADRREDVFHAFQRLHPRGRYSEGTGIGLPIARRIARRHDGDVTVHDAPDGGARFVVTLPRAGPAERPEQPTPRAAREF